MSTYGDGGPRLRIPPHLWEGGQPFLCGAGYLWGSKVQFVPPADLGEHIGWANPELRAFAMDPIKDVSQATRDEFLRVTSEERAEPEHEDPVESSLPETS